jgi:hypothetical protein
MISMFLVTRFVSVPEGVSVNKYYPTEIPVKLVTYSVVGFVAALIPDLFNYFNADLVGNPFFSPLY